MSLPSSVVLGVLVAPSGIVWETVGPGEDALPFLKVRCMFSILSVCRGAALLLATLAFTVAAAPELSAKEALVGPVSLQVPDDYQAVQGKTPAIRQASSGITIEATELPPEALHEFQGPTFLAYLQSLGFSNPTYAPDGLKRSDPHTYVLADAKGVQGPEKRFLLVIGGQGRAAIVTAYAPDSELASGHASRTAIEAILDTATVAAGTPAKP
jgi:hypothetical protein